MTDSSFETTHVRARADAVFLAVRWNAPSPIDGKPAFAEDCDDHPAVKPTTYMELNEAFGTSGCSVEHPHWTWPVMGVINTDKGKLFVSPGDYVVWFGGTSYLVLSEANYLEIFETMK